MKISLKGTPIAKARHRLSNGRIYDPQATLKYQIKKLLFQALKSKNEEFCPTAKSFSLAFTFLFTPPKSDAVAKRNAKLWQLEPCLVSKDLDNLEKFYCDCANEILFKDDHLVIKMASKKLWAKKAQTEIEIMEIQDKKLAIREKNAIIQFDPESLADFGNDIASLTSKLCQIDMDNLSILNEDELRIMGNALADFAHYWADDLKKIKSVNQKIKEN